MARERMRALRILYFSQYISLLIERDHETRGSLTVVKEETPDYLTKSRPKR